MAQPNRTGGFREGAITHTVYLNSCHHGVRAMAAAAVDGSWVPGPDVNAGRTDIGRIGPIGLLDVIDQP